MKPRTPRRPARIGCWVASGLTAAVAVGSVTAMAKAANEPTNDRGDAFGTLARSRGEAMATALMAAADPGVALREAVAIRRLGGAGVS